MMTLLKARYSAGTVAAGDTRSFVVEKASLNVHLFFAGPFVSFPTVDEYEPTAGHT
jgi:hypothetical protein